MAEKVLAAVKVGPSTTELRELDLPPIPDDAALMKVAVAGVCGTDVTQYRLPLRNGPLVMGHENVGYLARVGKTFAAHKGRCLVLLETAAEVSLRLLSRRASFWRRSLPLRPGPSSASRFHNSTTEGRTR